MKSHAPLHRQAGAASFKTILIVFAVVFTVIIVLVVATAPTKQTGTQNATGQPQNNDQKQPDAAKEKDELVDTAVPLPDNFRRFTNKKYQLSLAYPDAWGGFTGAESMTDPILRVETKEISYAVGTTPLAGKLGISAYKKDDFQIAARSQAPILRPAEKDGKLTWTVDVADPADTKYRSGSSYPVASRKNPAGIEVFDFSWLVGGRRQARWLYATKNSYILVSVPPLAPANGANPREDDLVFYKAFAESIRDTITIPPASASSATSPGANNSN